MMKVTSAIIGILLLSSVVFSQTRTRRTSTPKRSSAPTTSAAAQQASSEAKTAGATKVAEQIKNLTRFVYLLGGVAKGIEQVDAAAQKNEASPTALQQNAQNKTTVKSSLQNVREGLDQLEIYFRSTPELQSYYLKLVGSASGAASAEDLAGAGRFDQAGRSLLGVVNRLTDVLLAMR